MPCRFRSRSLIAHSSCFTPPARQTLSWYAYVLTAERAEAEARRIRDVAFAAQVVQLGDIGDKSAAFAQSLASRVAETESRLALLEEELRRRKEALNAQDQASLQPPERVRSANGSKDQKAPRAGGSPRQLALPSGH